MLLLWTNQLRRQCLTWCITHVTPTIELQGSGTVPTNPHPKICDPNFTFQGSPVSFILHSNQLHSRQILWLHLATTPLKIPVMLSLLYDICRIKSIIIFTCLVQSEQGLTAIHFCKMKLTENQGKPYWVYPCSSES